MTFRFLDRLGTAPPGTSFSPPTGGSGGTPIRRGAGAVGTRGLVSSRGFNSALTLPRSIRPSTRVGRGGSTTGSGADEAASRATITGGRSSRAGAGDGEGWGDAG